MNIRTEDEAELIRTIRAHPEFAIKLLDWIMLYNGGLAEYRQNGYLSEEFKTEARDYMNRNIAEDKREENYNNLIELIEDGEHLGLSKVEITAKPEE